VSQARSRDGTTIAYDRAVEREIAQVIPGARLRTLPGQTHNVAAAALAPVLKEFFAP